MVGMQRGVVPVLDQRAVEEDLQAQRQLDRGGEPSANCAQMPE